jgi:demethylmenaquinone methyltransferase/2-methoxy-6-polyprenyl-1,4-benzoquinol methylase
MKDRAETREVATDGAGIRASAPETVREMFGKIAGRYDLTNTLLSCGVHRLWNRTLAAEILKRGPSRVLDLCCGTGAITRAILQKTQGQSLQISCVDFCPAMLTHASAKLAPWICRGHSLHYLCADAQHLPLPEQNYDAVTVAYGIRNVEVPEKVLQEVLRVLRPGGQLAILELTRPHQSWLRMLHAGYLRLFVPLIGCLSTREREAYRYLAKSIQAFIDPVELEQRMRGVGFERVQRRSLFGGVCTLLTGTRPPCAAAAGSTREALSQLREQAKEPSGSEVRS